MAHSSQALNSEAQAKMAGKGKGKLCYLKYVIIMVVIAVAKAKQDQFHEELFLKPMSSGHVYAYFQFTTVWNVDVKDEEACK